MCFLVHSVFNIESKQNRECSTVLELENVVINAVLPLGRPIRCHC